MSDPSKFAEAFRDMADRIERNLESDFAGAILIVPPVGDPVAVMINDPTKDMESFWVVAESKIQIATMEYRAGKQGNAGFGGRRG